MSWYGADRSTGRPLAWHMHEAELTAGINGSRTGWAQVGLAPIHRKDECRGVLKG